ncbi:MAG: hypothetical protein Q7T56_07505 [Nocardioidaceae bacterium]|nr:hypothetical protein [Nocardioidaceae bacterium]
MAEDEQDTTELLAAELSVELTSFIGCFGGGWTSLPSDGVDLDVDTTGLGNLFGPWHVHGRPFQIAMRPTGRREVEIGTPLGRWVGAGSLLWVVDRRERIDVDDPELSARLSRLAKTRRTTFRYCTSCARIVGPEDRDGSTCHDCMSRWLGVVF